MGLYSNRSIEFISLPVIKKKTEQIMENNEQKKRENEEKKMNAHTKYPRLR